MEEVIKSVDEKYCSECGKIIKKSAVFCEYCGAKLQSVKKHYEKENDVKIVQNLPVKPSPKSKAIAIVLSLLFGYWSWLYTFQKDRIKFWIFFSISMFFLIIYFVVSCATLAVIAVEPTAGIGSTNRGILIIIYAINFISGCWAFADGVRSPISFYLNYPNEDRFQNKIGNTPLGRIKV